MGTYVSAYLGYGFGWESDSEPPVIAAAIEAYYADDDDADYFDTMEWVGKKVEELGLQSVTVEWHGDLEWSGTGIFVGGKSRILEGDMGALVAIEDDMQSPLEEELAEYAELVLLAKELGLEPDVIGWYIFSNRG